MYVFKRIHKLPNDMRIYVLINYVKCVRLFIRRGITLSLNFQAHHKLLNLPSYR